MNSSHHPAMLAAGQERLARVVADNLKRRIPAQAETDRTALANFIAGGFMAMLQRWKKSGNREQADDLRARFEGFCEALLTSYDAVSR